MFGELGESELAVPAFISKATSYKLLLARLETALNCGFHLEASWIAYAVIEDRLLSALEKTGGIPATKKGQLLTLLGTKIAYLHGRLSSDPVLRGAILNGAVLDDVSRWTKSRNYLMHDMARDNHPWTELDARAQELARSGRDVTRNLCSAVMRLAKRKRKRRVPSNHRGK